MSEQFIAFKTVDIVSSYTIADTNMETSTTIIFTIRRRFVIVAFTSFESTGGETQPLSTRSLTKEWSLRTSQTPFPLASSRSRAGYSIYPIIAVCIVRTPNRATACLCTTPRS